MEDIQRVRNHEIFERRLNEGFEEVLFDEYDVLMLHVRDDVLDMVLFDIYFEMIVLLVHPLE